MADGAATPRDEPRRDFGKMFDRDRTTLIKSLVGEMEGRMRDIESAQGNLNDICESAKDQKFTPRQVAAMKKIAKLRLRDKKAEAQQEMMALEQIGKAVDFDVFDSLGSA